MVEPQAEFLRKFYQNLGDRPLTPNEHQYVELYDTRRGLVHTDPVDQLATVIEWTEPESAQLFSGFRGTGKTTELKRLESVLSKRGCIVAFCDMEDYFNLSTPVDISDFLVTIAAAFGDALITAEWLKSDPSDEGYWTRFSNFLTRTNINLDGLEIGPDAKGVKASLKSSLKQDPSFRQRLQERMKGHLGSLVADVRQYMAEVVQRLKETHGRDSRVVLILDSIEKIRGTTINAHQVEASLEVLFAGHADKLCFDFLHVVYTAPPWLKIRTPGIEGNFSGGLLLPCIKVRDERGDSYQPGLDALERVVGQRGDWQRLLGNREALDRLSLATGGYLRDFLRLLQSCCYLARESTLPLPSQRIDLAIEELRNDYLPIAKVDAVWLDRVRQSHQAELDSCDRLSELARFFDTHLVLCYRNGREWYGVHPLVAEYVQRLSLERSDP